MHQRLASMVGRGAAAVRGAGLWAGVDVDPAVGSGREVCEALAERGVLAKETHGATLRLAPPLVISQADLDMALDHLETVLATPGGTA
jgi:ornithine--oxo-acid transaminase